ncbi:MAG: NAD(+) kinase [Gammaproteobacteria bacterium]|nr:NAD(+) kinase [Gammaproteobacteria bacterium]
MSLSFNIIALIGRGADERVASTMKGLAPHLAKRGVRVLVANELEVDLPCEFVEQVPEAELPKHADLIVAVGGDGTMLYASHLVARHEVPVLGINRGRLGFLADVTPDAMLRNMDEVLDGNFTREPRLLLASRIGGNEGPESERLALNDVVLQKSEAGRMLEFETHVDGRFVNSHSSDGMIIASPTGSTAYALSCNGPILQPKLHALVLVPISPHTLSDRPIVIPATQEVEIRMLERRETRAQVVCDGQLTADLEAGASLHVSAARQSLGLIHPPGYDYYRTLRSKLQWGRGSSGRPGTRKG